MTKVTVLGNNHMDKKESKIQFLKIVRYEKIVETNNKPSSYDRILLLSVNYYGSGLDLMYAYNGHAIKGTAYLGHFNDGIV